MDPVVNPILTDFTQVDINDPRFQHVTHILLDPSCSGSGRQYQEDLSQKVDSNHLRQRLKHLSTFQLRLITHAMAFPAALKIIYSTCSIYKEENEQVIERALKTCIAQERGWHIVPIKLNNTVNEPNSKPKNAYIQCKSETMIGFFVACLERTKKIEKII